MPRSIPPRTMRDVWDEEKIRGCNNYSSQRTSNKTSGTYGVVDRKGKLKSQRVQGQPRNIYKSGGCQGTVYSKKSPKSSMPRIKDALNFLALKEMADDIDIEIFETDKKINIIAELGLEKIIDVFYDAVKEEVVVHANKDYSIPLPKEVNTKTLKWSYNNGIMEITFQKN